MDNFTAGVQQLPKHGDTTDVQSLIESADIWRAACGIFENYNESVTA
jgi:hypothetical protein